MKRKYKRRTIMIRKFKKKFAQKKAFTLIELIVVIAIIGVLAAILIPTMSGFVDNARTAAGNANARTIYTVAASEYAFLSSQGSTPGADSYAKGGGSDFEDAVDGAVGTIDGTYTITVSETAVTAVTYTSTDGKTVGSYPTN